MFNISGRMTESDIDDFVEKFVSKRKSEIGEDVFEKLHKVAGNGISEYSILKCIVFAICDPSNDTALDFIMMNIGIGFIELLEDHLEEFRTGFSYYKLDGCTWDDVKHAAWSFRKTYVCYRLDRAGAKYIFN